MHIAEGSMTKKISVLLDEEKIRARVTALGKEITARFANDPDPIVLIAILKGSIIFLADLCRAIDRPLELEFMGVSSYGAATESSGIVQITQDLTTTIKSRNVVIVEDIVDTGLTVKYLLQMMRNREPKSISVCAFLEKPAKSKGEIRIDFLGFSIPDQFVIGYGLDYDQLYRNLPYVGVMGA
jgi:hypoxanthine phosphoribosyltransferase